MIVPKYWAEARIRKREGGRQVTVRRFGWSDRSQDEAQAHAEQRVRDAFDRIWAGETLPRFERRVAYNGADGMPIREEIVERNGDTVITRNGYGALCLNTPNVLFADIDDEQPQPARLGNGVSLLAMCLGVGGFAAGWAMWGATAGAMLFLAGLLIPVIVANMIEGRRNPRDAASYAETSRSRARRRVEAFIESHPDWLLRLYETPAGLRALAMHRTFDAADPDVAAFFDAVQADPAYVRMCRLQRCFRARVSPKPWRIGIRTRICPPFAAWDASHAHLPERRRWLDDYAVAAKRYASCRFIAELGQGRFDPVAGAVQGWHDELCRVDSGLPLA